MGCSFWHAQLTPFPPYCSLPLPLPLSMSNTKQRPVRNDQEDMWDHKAQCPCCGQGNATDQANQLKVILLKLSSPNMQYWEGTRLGKVAELKTVWGVFLPRGSSSTFILTCSGVWQGDVDAWETLLLFKGSFVGKKWERR